MKRNPILEELHAAREKLLADAGGDVHRFLEGVRKREAASGRLLQSGPQDTKICTSAAENAFPGGQASPASR